MGSWADESLLVSPDGRNLYAGGVVFVREPGTGSLRPLSGDGACVGERRPDCTPLRGGPGELTASPDGRTLYGRAAVTVLARRPATGRLAQLPGRWGCLSDGYTSPECRYARLPFAEGIGDVVVSPDGRNVYVSSGVDPTIAVFARGSGGRLRQLTGKDGCVSSYKPDGLFGPLGCGLAELGWNGSLLARSPDGTNLYAASTSQDGRTVRVTAFMRRRTP